MNSSVLKIDELLGIDSVVPFSWEIATHEPLRTIYKARCEFDGRGYALRVYNYEQSITWEVMEFIGAWVAKSSGSAESVVDAKRYAYDCLISSGDSHRG